MKPDFALNFTDTSIALLHRTAKGWLKIGETAFDAADLEDALDYMRKTALGLAPGGFTTKLVIPASQILYTDVDISGGDADRTAQEITNALEARTPYRADEIVWDWQRGEGRTARVAAVARETLAEAEAFATAHKFSPVGFVAIPDQADFDGEPWFGEAADARNYLAEGEEVERDSAPILLIDEARRRARAARQAEQAAAASEAESAPPAAETAPAPASEDATRSEKETGTTGFVTAPDLQDGHERAKESHRAAPASEPETFRAAQERPDVSAATEAPVAPPVPASPRVAQAELPLETDRSFDEPAPFGRSHAPALQAARETSGQAAGQASGQAAGPRVAITEITPLGPVKAPPGSPSAPLPSPVTPPVAASVAAGAAPGGNRSAAIPQSAAPSAAAVPHPAHSAPLEDDSDEAPFAHVPENTSFPDADEAPDLPPLPHLARRMAGLASGNGQSAAPGPLARAAHLQSPIQPPAQPPVQSPVRPAPARPAADPVGEIDDDLPPAPSAATLAAYGRSGRAAPLAGRTAAVPPAPPPPGDDDGLAAADMASGEPAGLVAPARNGSAASAGAKPARGVGSLAGLITAPSIPGTRKTRAQPTATKPQAPAGARPRAQDGMDDAARSLSQSPFAPQKTPGKPRFLGLILTAILLLCLALVAAWSSFYLSSNRNSGTEETQVASSGTDAGLSVSVDDEMLADGLDPEAEGVTDPGVAAATETAGIPAATDPAPDTALESESPPAVALLDAEDEIFLSTSDAPPPTFDALSLPGPESSAEAPPGVPMPPPPFGTVYRYDENQMLIPTAAGLPTPGGYMLFAGKPPRVPPPRSAAAEAAAAAARATTEAAATPDPATPDPAQAADAETAPASTADTAPATPPADVTEVAPGTAGNPSIAGSALTGTAPGSETGDTATATVTTATAEPAAQPDPDLADRRPRARPDRPQTDDDAALQTATPPSEFAGLRPRQRPSVVEEASARARADTATASLASEAEITLASATAPGSPELTPEQAANPSIMTISRRPAPRPKDFSRAVEAAVAAALRAPEPAPEPVQTAAVRAPEPAPKSKSKAIAKPQEEDEIDEPEVAAGPAPKIPTKASVAKQATYAKAINLSKVNLIGVYGQPSKRYALVRTGNGKYHKVSVGDRIDGGQVKAITHNEVRYQKGGRLIALAMPKG